MIEVGGETLGKSLEQASQGISSFFEELNIFRAKTDLEKDHFGESHEIFNTASNNR